MSLTEHPTQPQGWSGAFAALPLDTPDGDAWQRLQRARAQRGRKRWPAWFAAAAVLALAAVLPWQLTRNDDATENAAPARAALPATHAEAEIALTPSQAATSAPAATAAVSEPANAAPGPDGHTAAPVGPAPKQAHARAAAIASNRIVPKRPGRRAESTQPGSVAAATGPDASQAQSPRPWPQPAVDPQLERLYAESAQLEALVALARDDRVATGAAATLTSAYDAQVASIDASLREPDMDAARRTQLWQQRVDALRQLAGFESTQRALAAQGERYDAMLVSID